MSTLSRLSALNTGAGTLEGECRVFCRYLLSVPASDYVVARYVDAHHRRADLGARTTFDRVLVRIAGRGPRRTRVCDAYARLFASRGLLRRKLAMLLAILESSPDLHRPVELVVDGGRAALALWLVPRFATWVAAVAVGMLVLLPVQVVSRLRRGAG